LCAHELRCGIESEFDFVVVGKFKVDGGVEV